MSAFVVYCHLQFSATVHGRPNVCVCCLLSVRVLCERVGES